MELYGAESAARFDALADAAIAGREGLLRVADACLAALAPDARVLVVGCGTGTELLHLARRHGGWRFEAVEPAAPMLAVARRRIEEAGFGAQLAFHEQPLAGLRVAPCDAATALLVSQHLVDPQAADGFFRDLAANLASRAPLVAADLCAPHVGRDRLLEAWRVQAETAGVPPEGTAAVRARFGVELALRPPGEIEARIEAAGFDAPLVVFQSTIYRAWCTAAR